MGSRGFFGSTLDQAPGQSCQISKALDPQMKGNITASYFQDPLKILDYTVKPCPIF